MIISKFYKAVSSVAMVISDIVSDVDLNMSIEIDPINKEAKVVLRPKIERDDNE